MDPITLAAIGAPIAGGLIGAIAGNGDRDAANANAAEARRIISEVQVPELKEWLLQQYASAGTFTPDMMQALSLDPSAQGAISTNPQERQEQRELISRMIQQSKTGVTPEDQAAFDLATRASAGQAKAQQGAIMQNMQARGVGGSGMELASRLSAQQSEADRLQQAHLAEAAKKNELRLQALQASTGALSNLRGQDYQQALNLANANDARSLWNTQNAQNVSNQNVGNMNEAQKFNLANSQRIMDNNVGIANQQQQYNRTQLPMNQYGMNMGKATAMAGQYNADAARQYQQAGQTAGMWAGIGQGVGTGLTAMGKLKKEDDLEKDPLFTQG